MADDSQKEAQEKALLYQVLQSQMEQLGRQSEELNARAVELEVARSALGDIGKTAEGSEVLVPVGAGCYGFGKLHDNKNFMVEIGSGYVMKKTRQEALSVIEGKRKELDGLGERLRAEADNIRSSMDRIGIELNSMMTKQAQEKPEKEGKVKESDDEGISVE